jgi:hypothetical protein
MDYDVSSCAAALPFPAPPEVRGPPEGGGPPVVRSRRDLLCIEHVRTLRGALCGYARAHCGDERARWPSECAADGAALSEEAAVREAQEGTRTPARRCGRGRVRGETLSRGRWGDG